MVFLGIPVVYWVAGLAATLAGCAGCGRIEGVKPPPPAGPLPDPNPKDKEPNPPGRGPLTTFFPPENAFLALFRGKNIRSPIRVPGEPLADGSPGPVVPGQSEPRDGVFVMAVNRLGPAAGEEADGKTPYSVYSQWALDPQDPTGWIADYIENNNPDADPFDLYTQYDTMLMGRKLAHQPNNLRQGFIGTPERLNWGSWGERFAEIAQQLVDGGRPETDPEVTALRTVGTETALVWGVRLVVNEETGFASIRFRQAKSTIDGLADSPVDAILLPFSRPEAVAAIDSLDLDPAQPIQEFTVCDKDTAGQECRIAGGSADQITVTLLNLPRTRTAEEAVDEATANETEPFGALPDFTDERMALLLQSEISVGAE